MPMGNPDNRLNITQHIYCNAVKEISEPVTFESGFWSIRARVYYQAPTSSLTSGVQQHSYETRQFCAISIKCTMSPRDKWEIEKGKIVFRMLHELHIHRLLCSFCSSFFTSSMAIMNKNLSAFKRDKLPSCSKKTEQTYKRRLVQVVV